MAAERPAKAEEPCRGAPARGLGDAGPTPLVVWAARLSLYFLAQGGLLLLSYAYYGFDTDPQSFSVGFRLDPIQAAVNFAWGLAGAYVGFYRPRHALGFVLAFGAFYTLLAGLSTFTPYAFGMQIGTRGKLFYWLAAAVAWAAALYPLRRKRRGP